MDSKAKRVLLLGSGLMSGTVLDYLLKRKENYVTVASNILADAEKLCLSKERCKPILLDILDEENLKKLIRDHDLVLSMIPAVLQKHLVNPCLEEKKNLVTSSYTRPEMYELSKQIADSGIIFLNECGLDPGIDHMTAMKVINEVQEHGGKVVEFESFCGGLVDPEYCDNPFGYKFSWSPIGALRSLKNDAVFLYNDQIKTLSKDDLLYESQPKDISMALSLEGYPNRDSMSYKDLYGLNHARVLIRGTLRYQGFTLIARSLIQLGLFEEAPIPEEMKKYSWREFLSKLVETEDSQPKKFTKEHMKMIVDRLNLSAEDEPLIVQVLNKIFSNLHYQNVEGTHLVPSAMKVLRALKWAGFFDSTIQPQGSTFLESVCSLLESKMLLKPGEKDLIVLQHRFMIEHANGKREIRNSTLIKSGSTEKSAMAQCVGYTVAIAAQLVLDGVISQKGVVIPIKKEVYEPILALLEKEGIRIKEESE